MAPYFYLNLLVAILLFLTGSSFGLLFFHLEREETSLDEDVLPISNQTSDSQTSCFLNCLNHNQCCYVQVKQTVNHWICSLYPVAIQLKHSTRDPYSNVFLADKEKFFYKDCLFWFQLGYQTDGVYDILVNGKAIKVFCDMTNEGGGWTVLQRRIDGAVDFTRTWDVYKNGFGDIAGEYWLGNELIHQMTKEMRKDILVRIKGTNFQGVTKYIIFKGFWIEGETSKYKLHTGVFESGNEALSQDWLHHNGMAFSTLDRDNDLHYLNCAATFGGGWWHKGCFEMNPNNPYSNTETVINGRGITMRSWQGHLKALKYISMSFK